MKTFHKTTNHPRGRRSHPPLIRAMSFGILASAWIAQVHAENVDSEIVLLVDITRSGLNDSQFSDLMDGYATAFSSSDILNSIQSGAYGRIAVTIMFFGDSSIQTTGVPWMMIGNLAEAQQFASLARNVARPFSATSPDVGAGLAAATQSFGSETGGPANGFESVVQIIEVASSRPPANSMAGTAAASSADALADGVDLINSMGLGNRATQVDAFYAANVIGSTIPGVTPSSSTSPLNGTLATVMTGFLDSTVQEGATASNTAVPEPSTTLGLIPAMLLLIRRKRN
jgi:hypothetical protein